MLTFYQCVYAGSFCSLRITSTSVYLPPHVLSCFPGIIVPILVVSLQHAGKART